MPSDGPGEAPLTPDDLSSRLAASDTQVREHLEALRNTLLRGHGTILRDRDRSLMSAMYRSVVSDIGETLRSVLARHADASIAATEPALAWLDQRWSEDIHARLAKAGALGDLDLIAALAHRMAEHTIETRTPSDGGPDRSVAGRVSEESAIPADAIAADPRLAKALTDYLVENSRRFDGYQNPKLPLQELPKPLMIRLFWAVAAAWREQLIGAGVPDDADLDDLLETTILAAIDATTSIPALIGKAEIVTDVLSDSGLLAPTLLPGLVRDGDICLFEAVLTRLLRLPSQMLRLEVFEAAGLRLALAARTAGVVRDDFTSIWWILEPAIGRIGRPAEDAVALFDRVAAADAERVVRDWARRPEYLDALKQFRSIDTGR